MAHRLITQVVVIGARVFGRAFTEAWRQANAAKVASSAGGSSGVSTRGGTAGLTLDEAYKILNVAPTTKGGTPGELEHVVERFKTMFDQNDPTKGGSFYLQSKILRARERIEAEAKVVREKAEVEQELKEGWKPKIYKDR